MSGVFYGPSTAYDDDGVGAEKILYKLCATVVQNALVLGSVRNDVIYPVFSVISSMEMDHFISGFSADHRQDICRCRIGDAGTSHGLF